MSAATKITQPSQNSVSTRSAANVRLSSHRRNAERTTPPSIAPQGSTPVPVVQGYPSSPSQERL